MTLFFFTCGDAVEGLWHQIVDPLVQLWGRAFTVDLVYGGVGAGDPLHQPLKFAVTGELVSPQVSDGRKPTTITSETSGLLHSWTSDHHDFTLWPLYHHPETQSFDHLQQLKGSFTAACNFNVVKSTHTFFSRPYWSGIMIQVSIYSLELVEKTHCPWWSTVCLWTSFFNFPSNHFSSTAHKTLHKKNLLMLGKHSYRYEFTKWFTYDPLLKCSPVLLQSLSIEQFPINVIFS